MAEVATPEANPTAAASPPVGAEAFEKKLQDQDK